MVFVAVLIFNLNSGIIISSPSLMIIYHYFWKTKWSTMSKHTVGTSSVLFRITKFNLIAVLIYIILKWFPIGDQSWAVKLLRDGHLSSNQYHVTVTLPLHPFPGQRLWYYDHLLGKHNDLVYNIFKSRKWYPFIKEIWRVA